MSSESTIEEDFQAPPELLRLHVIPCSCILSELNHSHGLTSLWGTTIRRRRLTTTTKSRQHHLEQLDPPIDKRMIGNGNPTYPRFCILPACIDPQPALACNTSCRHNSPVTKTQTVEAVLPSCKRRLESGSPATQGGVLHAACKRCRLRGADGRRLQQRRSCEMCMHARASAERETPGAEKGKASMAFFWLRDDFFGEGRGATPFFPTLVLY